MRLQEYRPTVPGGGMRLVTGMGSGLVSGLVFGALMAGQHLTASPGMAAFAAYATVTGALLGAIVGRRPYGLAVSASGGLLLGLLGWVAWWLTGDPRGRGAAPAGAGAAAATAGPGRGGARRQ